MPPLVCPFCNAPFDYSPSAGRVVCPRCGEAVPAKLLPADSAAPLPTADRPAPPESAPRPSRPRPVVVFSVLLLAAVLAGLGIWYFAYGQSPDPASTGTRIPPATRPPLALTALRHLPAETRIALALQPSPLIQYAGRDGKPPETLLAEWGLPAALMAGLNDAGIPLEKIDHLAVGVGFPAIGLPRLHLALFLSDPIADERHFREVLKVRQLADKPGRAKVELPGVPLPMELQKPDDTTYLFSSDGPTLDAMIRPQEGAGHLTAGLRESLDKIDPASFAWVATDSADWADLPALKLGAGLLKRGDMTKRLKGLRALAVGLTLSPGLEARASMRLADAKAAGEFAAAARPKIADPKIELVAEGDWATVRMPGASIATGVPGLLSLFDR